MFYIGCPMWGYKEWLGTLFPPHTPQSEFLRIYSHKLTTVEGNTLFYAVPSADTILHWAQETPPSFRFCPKVPRTISHEPGLALKQTVTLAFLQRMQLFDQRLGPIFLQLPPFFGPDQLLDLEAFLKFWPTNTRLAVEVRHPDFFKEPHTSSLNQLLQDHHVARVIMDTRPIRTGSTQEQQMLQARERKPHLPVQICTTTDIAFVRYIGHPKIETNIPFLENWAQQLAQWHNEGLQVYVFCHCPFEEHSPAICYELYQRVNALIPLPTLSWRPKRDDEEIEQMRLF